MEWKHEILARLAGAGSGEPFFLPDLSLWYKWHRDRGSLPAGCEGAGLPAVCRALGLPAWLPLAPWRMEHNSSVRVTTTEGGGERIVRYETDTGLLVARWELGPDGDWWQTEYPVKCATDLEAARAVVTARTYIAEPDKLEPIALEVGDDGVVALELPMRPYADIIHTVLGWDRGLLLWAGDGREILGEMLHILEDKLAALVTQLAGLPADVVLAPDNLDGQFISPRSFKQYYLPSYSQSADTLRANGKRLVVHAGGPVRRLLPLLAEAGVDCVEGVAGPPQGDATLADARAAAPGLGLWGGIAQDYLLDEPHDEGAFRAAARAAVREAQGDGHMLIGVADRVPAEAGLARLRELGGLEEEAR